MNFSTLCELTIHGCLAGIMLGYLLHRQHHKKLNILNGCSAAVALMLLLSSLHTMDALMMRLILALISATAVFKCLPQRTANIAVHPDDFSVDVRSLTSAQPFALFDPRRYFSVEQGLFLGLDQTSPVYCPVPWPHIQICGSTGSGKSALLGVLAAQCLHAGEAVVCFDPKNDHWMASVLQQAAQDAHKSFNFIDLRPEAPAQFNLIAGLGSTQLEELLIAGLDLHERGNDADFYRISERQAVYRLAQDLRPNDTLIELYRRNGARIRRQAPAVCGRLEELLRLSAAQGQSLEPLTQWLKQGGALYILGSLRHEGVQRLQKMLLLRLLQLAEERPAGATRTIALLLDEFRHYLCKSTLEALATARDKDVHLILAHQSLGDLQTGPEQLRPQAVHGMVTENCTVKIVFRLQDPDTAQWFAQRSGDRLTYTRQWQFYDDDHLKHPHQVQERQSPYCDRTTLLHLPTAQAMVFGLGLAQPIRIAPFPCSHQPLPPWSEPSAISRDHWFEHLES